MHFTTLPNGMQTELIPAWEALLLCDKLRSPTYCLYYMCNVYAYLCVDSAGNHCVGKQ